MSTGYIVFVCVIALGLLIWVFSPPKSKQPSAQAQPRREYREQAEQMTSACSNPQPACSDGLCYPNRHGHTTGRTLSQAETDAAYIAAYQAGELQAWANKQAEQAESIARWNTPAAMPDQPSLPAPSSQRLSQPQLPAGDDYIDADWKQAGEHAWHK